MITFGPDVLLDFERASRLEWLETNGLGGWASSSITFANTRRYHGMLVAALPGRTERTVLVSKFDETVAGVDLAANRFPGCIHPRGFEHLLSFRRGLFPVWEYVTGGITLRKTIVAPHGRNVTIILYEVLDCASPFELRLSPFLAGRDYHALIHDNDAALPYVHLNVPGATFEAKPDRWKNFVYDRERERGLDCEEDLFTPGSYVITLNRGDILPVVLATEDRKWDALAMIEEERQRRESLISTTDNRQPTTDLTLASDQFLIDPDGTNEPEFNSADAGLWLFIAIWRYREAAGDDAFVHEEALPVLREAINWLERGTRYNIHVDLDGLLYAGARGVALTWMDAIVDGEAVTPRRGKPVEINALWYNALRIVATLTGDAALASRADTVREAFETAFWNRDAQVCFDVVNPNDASIRPNQLFAIALPFPLFDDVRAEEVLGVCESQLLTPVGLRTLAPSDPCYLGQLLGDQHARDTAYHQGTVWPWLLGAYIDALIRVRGDAGRETARGLIANMQAHLN